MNPPVIQLGEKCACGAEAVAYQASGVAMAAADAGVGPPREAFVPKCRKHYDVTLPKAEYLSELCSRCGGGAPGCDNCGGTGRVVRGTHSPESAVAIEPLDAVEAELEKTKDLVEAHAHSWMLALRRPLISSETRLRSLVLTTQAILDEKEQAESRLEDVVEQRDELRRIIDSREPMAPAQFEKLRSFLIVARAFFVRAEQEQDAAESKGLCRMMRDNATELLSALPPPSREVEATDA